MAQASVSRQSIREAIAALDAQPIDPVRDAGFSQAIALVRDALLLALDQDSAPEYQQLVVLIADLSGYTAIAERMDAEQVREAINAMWLELDGVITAWGGRIEQHAGDSLMALFGLPWPRRFDAWRAVQAAQALQLELDSFNERVRQRAKEMEHASWLEHWPGPQMRVGVHEGPVIVIAEAGRPSRPVTGDAVRIAYELEEAAPAGGTLVSAVVRNRIQEDFRLDAPRPRLTPRPSFLVGSPKPQDRTWRPGTVLETSPRLIGRSEALDDLDSAFQRAADSQSLEIVTIIGEPGSGKTRLVHEFLPRLQILAPNVTVLRGQAPSGSYASPFALVHDMMTRYLGIFPAHSASAVRSRIRTSRFLNDQQDDQLALAGILERLLLPTTGQSLTKIEVMRLVQVLMLEAAGEGALVIVADDLHNADAHSLAVLDELLHAPLAAPVLFVGMAQPSLLDRPVARSISWLGDMTDPFLPATRLTLPRLSAVETRLLAAELLRPANSVPLRLIDLMVAESNGNAWAIEETVKHLIDVGIVMPGTRWQFDLARAEDTNLPRTLVGLAATRIRRLPEPERAVLGAAAVVGLVFWDTAVMSLLAGEVAEQEVLAALSRLTSEGWLSADNQYSFGDAQAYVFAHTPLHQAALDKVTSEVREQFTARFAAWQNAVKAEAGNAHWQPAAGVTVASAVEATIFPGASALGTQ